MNSWTELHSKHFPVDNREWVRPGYIGGWKLITQAGNIRFGHAISGSGLGAFGEKTWCCGMVSMNLDFPEGCDEIAFKFIYELQDFIDKFLDNNDLKIPDGCRAKDYDEDD